MLILQLLREYPFSFSYTYNYDKNLAKNVYYQLKITLFQKPPHSLPNQIAYDQRLILISTIAFCYLLLFEPKEFSYPSFAVIFIT